MPIRDLMMILDPGVSRESLVESVRAVLADWISNQCAGRDRLGSGYESPVFVVAPDQRRAIEPVYFSNFFRRCG